MARLQILELPEGTGDDRPPFVLVIDQYVARRYVTGLDQPEPVSEFDGIAERLGARAVLVFEETVDIPANDLATPVDEAFKQEADAHAVAVGNVRNLPEQPEAMDAQHPDPFGYLHGYRAAIREAKRATYPPERTEGGETGPAPDA